MDGVQSAEAGSSLVSITVLSVTPMRAGKLFALASVEIDIDGIRIEVRGIRAMRVPTGATRVELPTYRRPADPDRHSGWTHDPHRLDLRAARRRSAHCQKGARPRSREVGCPEDQLPEPVELTPEQLAAQAAEEQRDRQRRLDWAVTVQALNDNAMAVTRAMRRFRDESEQDQVERVLSSYEDGLFLIDRLGAGIVADQDLAVVLLDLRRRLRDEYGDTPAVMMLIDRAVSAYQDFTRVTGWVSNLAIGIEHEFFGRDGPSAQFREPLFVATVRAAPRSSARGPHPACRALRPRDARGAGRIGDAPSRSEPSGGEIETDQKLGHSGLTPWANMHRSTTSLMSYG
jgi:hypothetical protein